MKKLKNFNKNKFFYKFFSNLASKSYSLCQSGLIFYQLIDNFYTNYKRVMIIFDKKTLIDKLIKKIKIEQAAFL